jgi:hypothetical protein
MVTVTARLSLEFDNSCFYFWYNSLLLLMLLLHLLPPLYRVFTIVCLKQTMFTGHIMLQPVSCTVNGTCNAISSNKRFIIIVIIININSINISSIAKSSHIV